MKAVVMAGGFGSRIQPLTNSRPKPMLPIVNRPMMEHTMMTLRDIGITEFIVLLYFKPDVIKDYFKDGSEFGIKISYVIPDNDYGTAGAVKLAQNLIGDENFIIVSGDLVTDFDFNEIINFHTDKKAELSIGLTSVENPLQFGVVIANEDNVIEKFLEKPSWGEVFSDTINTGIYIIEPEILNYIPENKNFDFAKDLFPLLMKNNVPLMGYNLNGYWRDVGNPESYREVFEDILNNRFKFKIPGKKSQCLDGTLYSDQEYTLAKGVEITDNVVLGKNVSIQEDVKLDNVVIGDNVEIKKGSIIRNSVLWENITVGKNSRLSNCVICNNNNIGKNVNAKAGLILAEGCDVGEFVSFEQDVTIWPDKKIEPASIVSNNLVLGSKYKNSIFENGTVIGKSNIELSCEMATKLAEAFGAQLPKGSKVVVGRDHDKNSRMLKRAFLGGLLSAGVDVLDIKSTPRAVLRHTISNDESIIGGAHFKQSFFDPTSSEITLFDGDGLRINAAMSKEVEKSFFQEKFRRVGYSSVGKIYESVHHKEQYKYRVELVERVRQNLSKCDTFSVAVDLMHSSISDVFPAILNDLNIENITLNAYYDEKKLLNTQALKRNSKSNISKIVKSLDCNIGVIIYPNEQFIRLVTNEGEVLDKVKGLLSVLHLIDMNSQEKRKVLLPSWAPDIIKFDNLEIERGKYSEYNAQKLKEYYLVATVDGNYTFTEFGVTRDAMYASLKIMELVACSGSKLSGVSKSIGSFEYKMIQVDCAQALKGKMMRKFLEVAKSKKSSSADGVKIWENETDWILMIPDQYSDHLNLYIQAKDKESAQKILEHYSAKIQEWSKE
jgi:mannose-1-phosphate guanylyltransferase/phosphomannomutase